jgi:hypothetical protein
MEELKENMQREVFEVSQEELLWVNFNLFIWYRVCACRGTAFLPHLLKRVSLFCCFYEALVASCQESLAVLGGESRISCWKPGSDSCV